MNLVFEELKCLCYILCGVVFNVYILLDFYCKGVYMKVFVLFVLVVFLVGLFVLVMVQFQKVEDVVKYCKLVLMVMGYYFGWIGVMVNGWVLFDVQVVVDNVVLVEMLSKLLFVVFGEGIDKGEIWVKLDIWIDQVKFKQVVEKMQVEVVKLLVVVKIGNLDSVKEVFGVVGKSCKVCYDVFCKD